MQAVTDTRPPGSEPTEQVPAASGGGTEAMAPTSGRGAPASGRRLVSSYPPSDLTQRVRKLADPSGASAASDGTLIDRQAQPLVIDDLSPPIRQMVLDAIRARSRALDHLSVRLGLSAAILVLVLGAVGSLAAAWVCAHAVTPALGSEVTTQTLLLYVLSALAAVVTAWLAYCILRLTHLQAVRSGRGLLGLGLGAMIVVAFWVVTVLVYQPWSFPGPAQTRTVPLSTIESALIQNHYRVLTYGQLSAGPFSSDPAIFLQKADHTWEAAPLPQPVPLFLGVDLVRARSVPISAVNPSIGANQLRSLRQHNQLVGILLAIEAAVAAGLFLLQRVRWRRLPQVPVSERELRRLVEHIHEYGATPIEWSLGEDRLV